MSDLYNKELLDKDVKLGNIKERCKEASYNYHNNLLQLMDMKVNGHSKEDNITEKYSEVVSDFSSVVALQNNIVRLSFEIAKDTLQRAFEISGLDEKDLTDLEKRVYSGETIVGDRKKMYWTEDGWKEGEKDLTDGNK